MSIAQQFGEACHSVVQYWSKAVTERPQHLSHVSASAVDVQSNSQPSAFSTSETPEIPVDEISVTGPVSAAKYTILSIQRMTGAPWWVTLIGCGVVLRVSTWPLTIQQLKASKGLSNAYAQASSTVIKLKGDFQSNGKASTLPQTRQREVFALMRALRARSTDPHAIWVAGSLVQVRAPRENFDKVFCTRSRHTLNFQTNSGASGGRHHLQLFYVDCI